MFADSPKIRSALRLEIVTIVWMVIEAAVAVGAGIAARSLLLVAFGIDSAIELASAVIIFRRFRFEFAEKSESARRCATEIRVQDRKDRRLSPFPAFCLCASASRLWSHDTTCCRDFTDRHCARDHRCVRNAIFSKGETARCRWDRQSFTSS